MIQHEHTHRIDEPWFCHPVYSTPWIFLGMLVSLFIQTETSVAQAIDSLEVKSTFQSHRFWVGTGVALGADLGVMVGLDRLWYRGYDRTGFHWHNDWNNWLQQDKLGHMATAWHLARTVGRYGQWSGMTRKQAGWYGGVVGTLFQSQIEILDGFSEAWGASWGDIVFNTIGGVMGGLQVAYPELNAVTIKYSYHRSAFYDTELSYFGNTIKDYDGASYWLVVRPEMLLSERWAAHWPNWLAVSVGHSADGLVDAVSTLDAPHRRVWLVGLDLDLLKAVHWPRRWMRVTAEVLSVIRLPAPALQITPDPEWHWLYY